VRLGGVTVRRRAAVAVQGMGRWCAACDLCVLAMTYVCCTGGALGGRWHVDGVPRVEATAGGRACAGGAAHVALTGGVVQRGEALDVGRADGARVREEADRADRARERCHVQRRVLLRILQQRRMLRGGSREQELHLRARWRQAHTHAVLLNCVRDCAGEVTVSLCPPCAAWCSGVLPSSSRTPSQPRPSVYPPPPASLSARSSSSHSRTCTPQNQLHKHRNLTMLRRA